MTQEPPNTPDPVKDEQEEWYFDFPPLHRITFKNPERLRETSKALVDHGYTPWSFWIGDDIVIQFHAPKDADLDFLRPHILPPRKPVL